MNKNYTGYNVEELLNDEYFIQWVLAPDVDNERYWNELREKDPELKLEIDQARTLVMHLQQDMESPGFSSEDEIAVWNQIKVKTDKNKTRKKRFRIFRIVTGVAAIICLCFLAVSKFYMKDKQDINYLAIIESTDQRSSHTEDVELILSENKKIAIPEKESQVEYNQDGDFNCTGY